MSDTRPLTEPERRYLQWHASCTVYGGVDEVVTRSCFSVGCLTLLALVLLAVIGRIAGFKFNTAAARPLWIAILTVPFFVWVAVVIAGLRARKKKPTDADHPGKPPHDDLAGGIARIHRFRATAVLRTVGKKDGRNYFVRLDDGRILFLGPWKPSGYDGEGMTFTPDERGFPSREFEIAVGPSSLLILDVVGSGEYLRPEDEFEMSGDLPRHDRSRLKLEPGDFVKVPWEDIRRTYG